MAHHMPCLPVFLDSVCLNCPVCIEKIAVEKTRKRSKNSGTKKGSTVTIVKEKVIAQQQFFLQNQNPWYSLSFLRGRDDLTVTNLAEKLEKSRC